VDSGSKGRPEEGVQDKIVQNWFKTREKIQWFIKLSVNIILNWIFVQCFFNFHKNKEGLCLPVETNHWDEYLAEAIPHFRPETWHLN